MVSDAGRFLAPLGWSPELGSGEYIPPSARGTIFRVIRWTMADLYTRFDIVPPQSYRYVTADCIALLSNERFQAPDRYERGHWARRRPARSGIAR